ncbi:outer membrane protein assembly factor BamB family protein [Sphaerisporangium fuscum]|uniref:outer membrane protein assembly factor BamB family protein n=1 Tax=Sphaerisporangium fuscum TaxID=2835868 RepID=UPI001BDD02DE|nr:PQQ-binding-like beta-propeller repeat protein [Sphaerisporangium fuscum]
MTEPSNNPYGPGDTGGPPHPGSGYSGGPPHPGPGGPPHPGQGRQPYAAPQGQPYPGQRQGPVGYPGQGPVGYPGQAPQPYPGHGRPPYPGQDQQPYPGQAPQPYPGQNQPPYAGPPQAYPPQPPPGAQQQGFPGQAYPGPFQGRPGAGPYPPQEPQPYGFQGRPPAPKRTGRTVLFVALGLVGLLILGGGTAWFVAGRAGGGTVAGGGAATWKIPFAQTDTSDFDGELMFGAWLTGDAVVRVQRDGVLAYSLKDGKRAWGTPAPSGSLCGATLTTAGGKGVIAYGGEDACDHLALIDTASGKLLWKVRIPAEKRREGSKSVEVPQLAMAGDAVIAMPKSGLRAFRLSDGKALWSGRPADGCRSTGLAASAQVVVVGLNCFPKGATYGFDPATGKIKWKSQAPDEGPDKVLSADPPVLMTEGSDQRFTVLDAAGKQVSDFSAQEHVDMLGMSHAIAFDGGNETLRVAVHGEVLYLATFPENVPGKLRERDYALAFDMRTGKRLWKSSGGADCKLNFVRADDKGVLALESGDRRDLAPRLVRIDAATGKTTAVAGLPQEYGFEGADAVVYERDGTVVIVPWQAVVAKNAISVVGASLS